MDRKTLIDKILNIEFHFFEHVRANASAPCAANKDEFFIQRRAQFIPWGSYTLKSYLGDLGTALKAGDNPIAQKYRCMESPQSAADTNIHIDQIVNRNVAWRQTMITHYPHFMSQGRALSAEAGEREEIAFDNYLRCELTSYSFRTVQLLYADVEQMHKIGINMCEVVYDALVKQYGYHSLAAAEAALYNGSAPSSGS